MNIRNILGFVLITATTMITSAKSYNRMIVFGDSLVDSGTYGAVAGPRGGGIFTVNPGHNWVENLGAQLGLEVKSNRQEGFNLPVRMMGGLNFAQGGARISQNPGSGVDKGYTARSMGDQIKLFTDTEKSFDNNDLVVVAGGAIDVLLQAQLIVAKKIDLKQALKNIDAATTDLSNLVKSVKLNGNPFILVPTLPDISTSPKSLEGGTASVQLFAILQNQFNEGVRTKIKGLTSDAQVHGWKIMVIHFDRLDQQIAKRPAFYGLTNLTSPACALNLLPADSALFCNEKTLVAPGADQTYKFADKLHPTPAVHRIMADFVNSQLN